MSAVLDVIDKLAEIWAAELPEAQVITGPTPTAAGATRDVIVTIGDISFTLAESPMGVDDLFDVAADIACTIELTMPGATDQRRPLDVAVQFFLRAGRALADQHDETLGIEKVMWVRMLNSGSIRNLTDKATLEKGRGVALPFTVRVQAEGF